MQLFAVLLRQEWTDLLCSASSLVVAATMVIAAVDNAAGLGVLDLELSARTWNVRGIPE